MSVGFRARPAAPPVTGTVDAAIEAFVSAAPDVANTLAAKPVAEEASDLVDVYPWEKPEVRRHQKQPFAARLPEELKLKLEYIAARTPRTSVNSLLIAAAEEYAERLLRTLARD